MPTNQNGSFVAAEPRFRCHCTQYYRAGSALATLHHDGEACRDEGFPGIARVNVGLDVVESVRIGRIRWASTSGSVADSEERRLQERSWFEKLQKRTSKDKAFLG